MEIVLAQQGHICWHILFDIPTSQRGVFEAAGWLKRPRLTACVTWATACPRRCFHPLSRGPCPCPLVKTFRTTRMAACCWMQSFPDGFCPHEKTHHWTHVWFIWIGGLEGIIGADFFFPKMCLKVCASEFHWVGGFSKVFFAFRLAVWRELELFSWFFVLWFSSVWKAQAYSESKKLPPSKTTNFHQTVCKLQTIVFGMRLNSRAVVFPVLQMSKDSASLIFHLGRGFWIPAAFFFWGEGDSDMGVA